MSEETVEERKERGRLELLAHGYLETEIHWYPPTDKDFLPQPGMTERQIERFRVVHERHKLGHWTVDMDAFVRVSEARAKLREDA